MSNYKKHESATDKLSVNFSNQSPATITWEHYCSKTELKGTQLFKSDYGGNVLGAHTKDWAAQVFEFHQPAEHTVNGKQHDLEMVTLLDPAEGKDDGQDYKHAGISILFSQNDFNVKLSKAEEILIDTFFETLAWN